METPSESSPMPDKAPPRYLPIYLHGRGVPEATAPPLLDPNAPSDSRCSLRTSDLTSPRIPNLRVWGSFCVFKMNKESLVYRMCQKNAATAHSCYHQKKKHPPTSCLGKPTALTVLYIYIYEIKSLNKSCHATTFYFHSAIILMQLDVRDVPSNIQVSVLPVGEQP